MRASLACTARLRPSVPRPPRRATSRVPDRASRTGLAAALAVLAAAAGGCGSSDGRESFLAHDASGAVFVQWTRTGDELAGSISATEVTQPRNGVFSSATQPAGQIKQQTQTFTGTVRGDSVRLQIGSAALGSRINGRLDGDTLELEIPLDEGVRAMRLKPAGQSDYDTAAQKIRDDEKQGQADVRTREQRVAEADITRAATAFQRALDPQSPDDPCRYLTPELRRSILSAADAGEPGAADDGCAAVIRDNERRREQPLYEGPQGVASIDFTDSLRSPRIGEAGPPGATVAWRPESGRGPLSQSRTTFTKRGGRWLVYRCCL